MSFFYAESKGAARKTAAKPGSRGVIPIHLMQEMGCKACPRDKEADKLDSPKMKPSGSKKPTVYLLGTNPSEADDAANDHWRGAAGEAIYQVFGAGFMKDEVRSNYIVQCRGEVDTQITECCRRRIIEDIEQTKPDIIVPVGDLPLRWITGALSKGQLNALQVRGMSFVAKLGNHVAHVMPIIYPNYAFKKQKFGKSEYELAMEHDVAAIKLAARSGTLPQPVVYDAKDHAKGVELVSDTRVLERRLLDMACLPSVGIDIETNGLRPYRIRPGPMLLTCAIGTFDHTIAFPIDHPDGFDTKRNRMIAGGLLGEWLMDSRCRKIAHHLGMEMEWFNYYYGKSVLFRNEWGDTMAMAHTLDERKGTKSLEVQSTLNFGFNLKAQSRVDAARLLEYPIKDTLLYNGADAKWTHKLEEQLRPVIYGEEYLRVEYERKVRLAPTLIVTEARGLPISKKVAKDLDHQFKEKVQEVGRKLKLLPEVRKYEKRFGPFDPGNDDQVLKLMKEICERPEVRVEDPRSGSVRETTDEEALSSIPAAEVPSAPLILEHRGATKLIGTYITPVLADKIIDRDGMMRPKYSSMWAETGRLNSEDPNGQNWPKRKFREVRRIITSDGWAHLITFDDGTTIEVKRNRCFLACDYGQIEFRVVGMASGDEEIIKACWTGYDVHKFWAERIVKLYPEIIDTIVREFSIDWDKEGLKTLRQEAKNKWVFPQLFGSSIKSCAAQLWLPFDVAEELAGEFWDTFRGAKRWQEKLLKSYERNLYVETLNGRRRSGPLTKNQIINHPIQGTAADIVLEGMCAVAERSFVEGNDDLTPNLNVHDDLTFIPHESNLDMLLPIIAEEMCKPRFEWINVPLIVEASIGTNWCDLKEIKKFSSEQIFNLRNPYKEQT